MTFHVSTVPLNRSVGKELRVRESASVSYVPVWINGDAVAVPFCDPFLNEIHPVRPRIRKNREFDQGFSKKNFSQIASTHEFFYWVCRALGRVQAEASSGVQGSVSETSGDMWSDVTTYEGDR